MRGFRPTAWLVLQDVALDAEWCDGQLVAATSARLVAEHLRIDPSTAASGLRALRDRGIVELLQAAGPNGRFGLATYTLHLPDGIDVCTPQTVSPCTEQPHTVNAHAETEIVLSCPWDGKDTPPSHQESPCTVEPRAAIGPSVADKTKDSTLSVDTLSRYPAAAPAGTTPNTSGRDEPADPRTQQVRRQRSSAPAAVEQGAFDLGSGAP